MKSVTEKDDPNREVPQTENKLPECASVRIDNKEPRWRKSKTGMMDSKRDRLRIRRKDSERRKVMIDTEYTESTSVRPCINIGDPKRASERANDKESR